MKNELNKKRIIIVGGGISGLSAAHKIFESAKERGQSPDVTVLESRDRLGGVIRTVKRDGFLIDTGPDNFVTAKPWALSLARRLGLESEILPTSEAHRRALVVHKGRLVPIPEGFLLMAPTQYMPVLVSPLFSSLGKLRMAMDLFIPPRKNNEDESLASFVRRRFGREALDKVVQPLISGIYTANPERLSLRATMPRFLDLESKYGSVIRGMRQEARQGKGKRAAGSGARYGMFVTFRDGLQTLVNALEKKLPSVRFRLNTPVSLIRSSMRSGIAQEEPTEGTGSDRGSDKGPSWQVQLNDGTVLEADGVILAGPSAATAILLASLDPTLATLLSSCQYASSAVVHLAYRRDQVSHPLDAFGFVVPVVEGRNIIASSFSSVKYAGRAPEGYVLLRAFMGGALHPAIMERDDQGLMDAARADLEDLLGLKGAPHFASVTRWSQSMPQYAVGHLKTVSAIRARVAQHKGLELAGNGFEGVGIPDCVRAGERAAVALLEALV